MILRSRLAMLAAGAALAVGAPSAYAQITLQEAWLRPAYAGQPSAMVYVDIHAAQPLTLVGARSGAAKSAELVLVDPPGPEPDRQRRVKELPVAANAVTRLAYLGSHVRLLGIRQDLKPGASIPLELTFADARGARHTANTQARVRGIAARRPDAPEPAK